MADDTAVRVAQIRAQHQPYTASVQNFHTGERTLPQRLCLRCSQPWPCEIDTLLDALAAVEQARGHWHQHYRELFDETKLTHDEHTQELSHLGKQVQAAERERDAALLDIDRYAAMAESLRATRRRMEARVEVAEWRATRLAALAQAARAWDEHCRNPAWRCPRCVALHDAVVALDAPPAAPTQ